MVTLLETENITITKPRYIKRTIRSLGSNADMKLPAVPNPTRVLYDP